MPKIQEGKDGVKKITLPSDIAKLKHWEGQGRLDFAEVDGVYVRAQIGDLVIRYTPPIVTPRK